MVNIALERPLLTLEQVRAMFPGKDGKPLHYETVRRWACCGVSGVKLETIGSKRRRWTTESALQRFFGRLDQVEQQPSPPQLAAIPLSKQAAASRRIKEELRPTSRR